MSDAERGLEISRLMRMRRKLKQAHPSIRERVELRIDRLLDETAQRFLEMFGRDHLVVKSMLPDRGE